MHACNTMNKPSSQAPNLLRGRLVHGMCPSGMPQLSEYRAWANAKQRCSNPGNPQYPRYGGRGIRCPLTFSEFFAEVGWKPSLRHTLDRRDNDKGYEKGNLRWVLPSEQNENKSYPRRHRDDRGRYLTSTANRAKVKV